MIRRSAESRAHTHARLRECLPETEVLTAFLLPGHPATYVNNFATYVDRFISRVKYPYFIRRTLYVCRGLGSLRERATFEHAKSFSR